MKEKKKSGKKRGGARSNAGRKKNVPNKSTKEIKELVRGIADFEKIIRTFNREATRKKLTNLGYLCGKKLLEYGFRKPPQQLTITGDLSEERVNVLRNIADKVLKEMI